MLASVLQALATLAFPAAAQWMAGRFKPAAWLGPVVLCYAFGLFLANTPGIVVDEKAAQSLSMAAVPLSIPLLLLSANVRSWLRLARSTTVSLVVACGAAVTSAYGVGRYFADALDESPKMAGMLVGVYTGGTVNLNAIGLALGARPETFTLLNAADVVLGGVYFFFLMTVAQPLLHLFLPRFKGTGEGPEAGPQAGPRVRWWHFALCLGVAAGITVVSAGVTFLAMGVMYEPAVLLLITTLALACSFSDRLRALPGAWALGEYLLLVFCVAIGSLADLRTLAGADPRIFLFTAAVMFGAILLHFSLSALLRIDADTVAITSTATVFGPAFVGPVAQALGNREVVVSGMAAGLIGYAAGNYLGLATHWLLAP